MTDFEDDFVGMPTNPAPAAVIPVALGILPGRVLAGRYEIVAKLGHGGVGAVFRAHDRELGEDVALKVILPDRIRDPGVLDRFRREVKLARKIAHPNVCRVFDMGEEGMLRFLTMEFVAGKSLREILAKGPLEPTRALSILHQIIQGVAAAHAQGVIHRDLKPDNVMIRDEGQAVVADFGLARTPTGNSGMSNFAGTPAYMSPEQLRGEVLDARSDIFALGIVAYEMLTGRLPFTGESIAAIATSTLRDPPAPFQLPTLPQRMQRGISAAINRALEKKPADRFASILEFGDALVSAGVDHSAPTLVGPSVNPPPPARDRRPAIVGVVVGALALLGIGGLFWRSSASPAKMQKEPMPIVSTVESASSAPKNVQADTRLSQAQSELETRAALAILEGDFESAVQALEQERYRAAAETNQESYGSASALLGLTYLEMGLPKKADEIAKDVLQRKGPSFDEIDSDWGMMLLVVRLRAGGIPPEELEARRIGWIDRFRKKWLATGRQENEVFDWIVWSIAYGLAAENRTDAILALEKMPRVKRLEEESRRIGAYLMEGKVCVLAGEFEKALEPLKRAADAGNALKVPLGPTKARFYLGLALQGKGDEAGARNAFQLVLDRWGKAKPHSVTAARAKEALKKLGPVDKSIVGASAKSANPFGTAIDTRR